LGIVRLFLRIFFRELPLTAGAAFVLFLLFAVIVSQESELPVPPEAWLILFALTFTGTNALILRDAIRKETLGPDGKPLGKVERTVLQYAREKGLEFERPCPGEHRLKMQLDCGIVDLFILADEDVPKMVALAVAPVRVPPDKRLAVAEYIARANYGMAVGCMDMDMEDGEVRARMGARAASPGPTPLDVEWILRGAVLAMERYLPGIMDVVTADTPPACAIAKAEHAADEERAGNAGASG
jgi:hypothetical protein